MTRTGFIRFAACVVVIYTLLAAVACIRVNYVPYEAQPACAVEIGIRG